jgi:uncharacterized protein
MMFSLGRRLAICFLLLSSQFVLAANPSLDELSFVKKMRLAKAGDPDAKMAVAEALEIGKDTKVNIVQAAKWYREAALTGNYEAQFRLARLVEKGAPGLKADKPTAIKLLQSAANHGHAASQNLLGQMLQNGDGIAKDEKSAVDFYRKAADQKLAAAQNNLGVMLLKGLGTDRNLDEAFKLFTLAANADDGWALNNLGGMYEMGWGTAKDLEKAKLNYEKAASKGIAIAATNMKRLQATPLPTTTPKT